MKKINIACVSGTAFHAKDFAKKLLTYPECSLKAVWDEDPERGKAWAAEMGCAFTEDYDGLLQDESLAGVVITSSVADHANLILRAAEAGKHIFVENGLAGTNEEAAAIREAVERNHIKFVLSDPVMKPPFRYAKELCDSGVLGTITNVRARITNERSIQPGPLDPVQTSGMPFSEGLGHHTLCLLQWFLGEPVSVTAMSTAVSGKAKACGGLDNSVAVFAFQSGAIGIAETGSLSTGWPYEVQIYGTKGCARVNKQLMQYHLAQGGWIDVPESQWPEPYTYILHDWVLSIVNDTPVERYGIDGAVVFTKMFTAAGRALQNCEEV